MTDNEKLRFSKVQIDKFNRDPNTKSWDPRNPLTLRGYNPTDFVKEKNALGCSKSPQHLRPDFMDVEKLVFS